MFRVALSYAKRLKTTTPTTTQAQLFHDSAQQRKWVQKYDEAIVAKYPRVLDVITGKSPRSILDTTERSALFVAVYKSGQAGSKRIRRKERHINFTAQVDSLVASWRKVEATQRKVNNRNKLLDSGKMTKLSTWKNEINAPAHQMDFTVTKSYSQQPKLGV